MSFLPEIENGALKKAKIVFKRPAPKKKAGYLPKGQRHKDGKKLWREYRDMMDWVRRL